MGDREAEYRAIDALNWSSLKLLEETTGSPKLFLYRRDHPRPDKDTFIFGRAVHCLAFEPGEFHKRFEAFDGKRDKRTAKYQKWLKEHEGVQPLKPDELQQAQDMVKALREDETAGPIIEACRVEEPCTWTDPKYGFKCKGRFDGIDGHRIVDLKTSSDFRPFGFGRQAARYLYHGQIAWYHDGAVQAKLIDGKTSPIIIAQEKEAPYDVAVYEADDWVLDSGRALYRRLLARLKLCMDTGEWPGAVTGIQPLLLPEWAPGCDNSEGF